MTAAGARMAECERRRAEHSPCYVGWIFHEPGRKCSGDLENTINAGRERLVICDDRLL